MPALQATISVNPTVVMPSQSATVQLVLQNTSTTTAVITSIQAVLSGTGAGNAPVNMGVPPYGQGLLTSIAAGATVQLNWNVVPYGRDQRYTGGSPASLANPGNMNVDTNPANVDTPTYVVGALVQTSDGVVSSAITQNLKVVANLSTLPPQPAYGQLNFSSSFNSGLFGLM